MNDALIEDDDLSLARKSLLPGTGFFVPDSLEGDDTEEIAAAIADADTVAICDADADGLGSGALIRTAFDGAAVVPTGPYGLGDTLAGVAANLPADTRVFVCDLCPDEYRYVGDALETLVERAAGVAWFDHHQWDAEVARAVREAGVDLVVGDSEAECSTDVTLRSLEYDFDARFRELATVTRDHDLWIRDDPRSDDLADYAHWAEPETYLETVREHGADLPPEAQAVLTERRVEKTNLIERAVERAEIREVGPWSVGVTYGRCSQNEVAEALREQGCDAAVVVKPSGSASIRGTDGFERCHEVAEQVEGGGHPKAAGCKPDIYDDMLDYAHHWTTRGAVTKQVILEAFGRLGPVENGGTGGSESGE